MAHNNLEHMELNLVEKELDEMLRKAGFYLQTYRGLDALGLLQKVEMKLSGAAVRLPFVITVYRMLADCYSQMGMMKEGIAYLDRCYSLEEDDDNKAAVAGIISTNYLHMGKKEEALEYANKALETAKAPELKSRPYQIQGAIAGNDGDYPKAIELLTKAAEMAEQAHCLTDLAMIIMDISAMYVKMGMYETALSEVYRAERYVKESHHFDLFQRCAIRRAKILYKMGRDEDAKSLIVTLDEQKIG